MEEYLKIFIDSSYPEFLDKYLNTKTLNRLKYITQFCGCDYTDIYNTKFLFTRFDHSLVVAHMTWHFTHDKKETLAALLHDVGTPCFAHCIDYVFGDYLNQESSEKEITDLIREDDKLVNMLKEDGVELEDLKDLTTYHILENHSPRLCTDRLDGVLHTAYIWMHTHNLEEIKKVFDDITILKNEDGLDEIGFKTKEYAELFMDMNNVYALELQGYKDRYVMKYISEIVKSSVERNLLTLDDLYNTKERDLIKLFSDNFKSWKPFSKATSLKIEKQEPSCFSIHFDAKKRNTNPLINMDGKTSRIVEVSEYAKKLKENYDNLNLKDYAYVEGIDNIE